MKSHLSNKQGVIAKHTQEYHQAEPPPSYVMKPIKQAKTILQRLVLEGNLIQQEEASLPGTLMDGKGEWGRVKMVRFTPSITRY